MQCLCCVSLQHTAIILSADTSLNSNNKQCLFHFQWVSVDAAVLVLCVSPTSVNMQTLNSNINKHHSQWVMAVDAVLVLRVFHDPACDNTKCRYSTQQTLFFPLSMSHSKCNACVVCLTVCSTQFQWVMAVDAVLVLCVSPAHDNTKCRHSTQQTLFVCNESQ